MKRAAIKVLDKGIDLNKIAGPLACCSNVVVPAI